MLSIDEKLVAEAIKHCMAQGRKTFLVVLSDKTIVSGTIERAGQTQQQVVYTTAMENVANRWD